MEISKRLFSGNWGLEREVLRVDSAGRLSASPHPFPPDHPQITVDFAEAQTELITGIHPSPLSALDELADLQTKLEAELGQDLLWPFSLPAAWQPDQPVRSAQFGGAPGREADRNYRQTLVAHHGSARQILSGLHLNYSFGPDHPGGDYFALARNFLRYQPILTYLLAASPWLSQAYRRDLGQHRPSPTVAQGWHCAPQTSSVRQGPLGYALAPALEQALDVRYDNLEEYLTKLNQALQPIDGRPPVLTHEREFYAAVRPKGRAQTKGQTLAALATTGVSYLEFRSFDLDPLARNGIQAETLLFLEVFVIAATSLDSPWLSDRELTDLRHHQRFLTQCSGGRGPGAPRFVRQLWHRLAPTLAAVATAGGAAHQAALARFEQQIKGQTRRMVDRFRAAWSETKGLAWGLNRARLHRHWQSLELSTRLVIEEADQRGLSVELLDPVENFLVMADGRQREFIKQATRTSADPYVSALIMENKAVTKAILQQAGLQVPGGRVFANRAQAWAEREAFCGRPAVVKPNSTNFGDGVSLLAADADDQTWSQALDLAFSLDNQVLVEEFAAGLEFRFLVIGGRTRAILHRIPANVTGDGVSSIQDLVAQKNRDPRRGEGYRKPLEKLRLGEIELAFLAAQGWSPDTILPNGLQVFLRSNSNISTGGDSLDYTDLMPPRYSRLAEQAAAAVGAQICGLDLILPNWQDASTEAEYTILELNFNPALHIHAYPAIGRNRQPAAAVLDLLGFPAPR